jgi:hypothetical protein
MFLLFKVHPKDFKKFIETAAKDKRIEKITELIGREWHMLVEVNPEFAATCAHMAVVDVLMEVPSLFVAKQA